LADEEYLKYFSFLFCPFFPRRRADGRGDGSRRIARPKAASRLPSFTLGRCGVEEVARDSDTSILTTAMWAAIDQIPPSGGLRH
jgi:hypothetical protein